MLIPSYNFTLHRMKLQIAIWIRHGGNPVPDMKLWKCLRTDYGWGKQPRVVTVMAVSLHKTLQERVKKPRQTAVCSSNLNIYTSAHLGDWQGRYRNAVYNQNHTALQCHVQGWPAKYLSPYLNPMLQSKSWGEKRYSSYSFSTRWGLVVSVTLQPHFSPGERTTGTHCTGGWVGPRAGLDTEATGKILSPLSGIEPLSPDRPARSHTLY
jgi:hypothetical protein